MSNIAETLLRNKASDALGLAAQRVADLRFFEQVQMRLAAGEDLSTELASFGNVDTTTAAETLQELIARCLADLKAGYWDVGNKKNIAVTVKQTFNSDETVPRYDVTYAVTTKFGVVLAHIKTANARMELSFDTSKCKRAPDEYAIEEAGKQLSVAMV
jgi:hypothetical protein